MLFAGEVGEWLAARLAATGLGESLASKVGLNRSRELSEVLQSFEMAPQLSRVDVEVPMDEDIAQSGRPAEASGERLVETKRTRCEEEPLP